MPGMSGVAARSTEGALAGIGRCELAPEFVGDDPKAPACGTKPDAQGPGVGAAAVEPDCDGPTRQAWGRSLTPWPSFGSRAVGAEAKPVVVEEVQEAPVAGAGAGFSTQATLLVWPFRCFSCFCPAAGDVYEPADGGEAHVPVGGGAVPVPVVGGDGVLNCNALTSSSCSERALISVMCRSVEKVSSRRVSFLANAVVIVPLRRKCAAAARRPWKCRP